MAGLTDHAVANALRVSTRTVQRRVRAMMTMAHVDSRLQLGAVATTGAGSRSRTHTVPRTASGGGQGIRTPEGLVTQPAFHILALTVTRVHCGASSVFRQLVRARWTPMNGGD